jgi:hypothetical protein
MKYLLVVVSTLGSLIAGPVTAHHSFFATYEVEKEITIEGVVAELRLVNPHALIYIDTVNEAGETQRWKVELAGKLSLSRRGWADDTVAEGDRVTVIGNQSRMGTPVMWWQKLILEDGTVFDDPFVEDGAIIDEQRRQRLEQKETGQ